MEQVKITSIKNVTHNVMHIHAEKPEDFSFIAGQAADISINKPSWKQEIRPFTLTSLPEEDHLEFHIKIYPDHHGVTEQIEKLKKNDELIIGDVFGEIHYKGEGVFIAGGAGITPFISMFKDLEKKNAIGNNKLIFANKAYEDIIERDFFHQLLGKNFINVLSSQKIEACEYGHITKEMIKTQMENDNSYFYVCGPPPMMDAVLKALEELGVDKSKITNEEY